MKLFRKAIAFLSVMTTLLLPFYTALRLSYCDRFSLPFQTFHTAERIVWWLSLFLTVYINVFPNLTWKKISTTRNKILEDGAFLLQLFLTTTVFGVILLLCGYLFLYHTELGSLYLPVGPNIIAWGFSLFSYLVFGIILESVLFWNGICRVYVTSVQLGIKWRVIGILCGLLPVVHIFVLHKIIRLAAEEAAYENEKFCFNQIRAKNQDCKTKYPILLVHGVFFRDFRFFNYWGRIPAELKKNGAELYYGCQQSAAAVSACGTELAERIRDIVRTTGCGKVNIIAHSKGGLDSRYAISCAGAAPYTASLTTINTPHRGCLFADYLLSTIPDSVRHTVARKYDTALKKLGDDSPDFLEAVGDLTASACETRNKELPDCPGVYYQSVASKMNRAASGRFPLNMCYPLVKHFDGMNDGLVSVESAKWGHSFTCLTVPGGRGISHGDMIDLNRENIRGFDVREFYVELVKDLKEKGY